MPDNLEITAGAGTPIATDLVGTEHYQRIKLTDGLADSSTPINVDIGVKANALRVCPANNITDGVYIGDIRFGESIIAGTNLIGKVGIDQTTPGTTNRVDIGALIPGVAATNLGKAEDAGHSSGDTGVMALTVRKDAAAALGGTDVDYQPLITDANGRLHVLDANTANMLTALQIMDDWDDSDKCKVIIQTGANAIGKLAANSGIDIGDVDVTSIIPGVAASNLGKAEDAGHTTGDVGVMALTVRQNTAAALSGTDADYQPLITDASGRLHVNVGALPSSTNTLEVVGDVAENAAVGGNPVLVGGRYDSGARTLGDGDVGAIALAVDGAVHIDDGGNSITVDGDIGTVSTVTNLAQMGGVAITLDEGVHGAGVQRVTIATDDDGVLSLGVIEGWDATHASAASADGPQIMGAGYSTVLPTDVGADGDAARICTDRYGRVLAGLMPQNFQATFTSADAQSAVPVKAKTGSRKMYILSLVVSVDTEMSVQFQDDAATVVLIEQLYLAANGGAHLTWPPEAPLVVDTNKDFDVTTSTSGNISVTITGYLAV